MSAEQAKSLDYFVICDKAWNAVVQACAASSFRVPEGIIAREEDLFIKHLPTHWRTAFTVHEMEYDVLSGGFSSFFFNHGDCLVDAALCGLLEIGCPIHHDLLAEAAKHTDNDAALSKLDRAFYNACESDADPREKLADYIVRKLALFSEIPDA